jgi:chromosome segregation ATPase
MPKTMLAYENNGTFSVSFVSPQTKKTVQVNAETKRDAASTLLEPMGWAVANLQSLQRTNDELRSQLRTLDSRWRRRYQTARTKCYDELSELLAAKKELLAVHEEVCRERDQLRVRAKHSANEVQMLMRKNEKLEEYQVQSQRQLSWHVRELKNVRQSRNYFASRLADEQQRRENELKSARKETSRYARNMDVLDSLEPLLND